MYLQSGFALNDRQAAIAFAQQHAFATIITLDDNGPQANLLPLLAVEENGQLYLRGHMAKANPQWQQFETGQNVLVVFQGPHAYISPNYYETRGVPTWNYSTVQMRGPVRVYTEVAELCETITALTNKYEQAQPSPWQPDIPERALPMLVGFEMTVNEIQAKFKMSQNRSEADRKKIIATLEQSSQEGERQVAELMQELYR